MCRCNTPNKNPGQRLSNFQVENTMSQGEVSLACEDRNAPNFSNIMPPVQNTPAPGVKHVTHMLHLRGRDNGIDRNNSLLHSANMSTSPTQYIDRENSPLHSTSPGQDIDSITLNTLAQEIRLIKREDNEYCNRMLGEQDINVPDQSTTQLPLEEHLQCCSSETEQTFYSLRRLSPNK